VKLVGFVGRGDPNNYLCWVGAIAFLIPSCIYWCKPQQNAFAKIKS